MITNRSKTFPLLKNRVKNLPPFRPYDLCMFRFMIIFTFCFTYEVRHVLDGLH